MLRDVDSVEALAKTPLLSDPVTCEKSPFRLADLIDEAAHLVTRYVRLPVPALAVLLAVWIAATYTYEHFLFCGYLALRSATPRCGKSRLLRLIAGLMLGAPKPNTNPTPAVLFRSQKKTMALDEVDRLRNADRENFGQVIALLNVGFEQGAVVERTEKTKGGSFEVREYPVYRPIALAGVESLADALSDRCFQIQMERTAARMPRFSPRALAPLFEQLRAWFQIWADIHGADASNAYEQLPDEVPALSDFDDRFQDISEPLVVLAAMADQERPEGPAVLPRLLDGLKTAAGRREPSGRERELIAFLEIVEPILNGAETAFVASAALVDLCAEREELSRIETARQLAGFLKHFDLFPKSRGGKVRGYDISREWVTEWQERYRT